MAKPIAEDSSVLGVSIKLCGKFQWFCQAPEYVGFIQLGDSGDPLAPKRIYVSRVISDGRAYLTNVEPGRYAVVAAYFRQKVTSLPGRSARIGSRAPTLTDMFTTYFPKEMVVGSVTEILPGSIRYLGYYEVEMNRLDDLDEVQTYYFTKLERSGEIGLIEVVATNRSRGVVHHGGPPNRRKGRNGNYDECGERHTPSKMVIQGSREKG